MKYYTNINGKEVAVYEKDGKFYTHKIVNKEVTKNKIHKVSPTKRKLKRNSESSRSSIRRRSSSKVFSISPSKRKVKRVSELERQIEHLTKELNAAIESCSFQYENTLRQNNIPEEVITKQRELIQTQKTLNDQILANKNAGLNTDNLENKLKLVTDEFQQTLKQIPDTIITFFANQVELEKRKYNANIEKLKYSPSSIELIKDNKKSIDSISEMLSSSLDELEIKHELETLRANNERLGIVLRGKSDELQTCLKKEMEISSKLDKVQDEFDKFVSTYRGGKDLFEELRKLQKKLDEKESFHVLELSDCMQATEKMTRTLNLTLDKTYRELTAVKQLAESSDYKIKELEERLFTCTDTNTELRNQYKELQSESASHLRICENETDKCMQLVEEYKVNIEKYKSDVENYTSTVDDEHAKREAGVVKYIKDLEADKKNLEENLEHFQEYIMDATEERENSILKNNINKVFREFSQVLKELELKTIENNLNKTQTNHLVEYWSKMLNESEANLKKAMEEREKADARLKSFAVDHRISIESYHEHVGNLRDENDRLLTENKIITEDCNKKDKLLETDTQIMSQLEIEIKNLQEVVIKNLRDDITSKEEEIKEMIVIMDSQQKSLESAVQSLAERNEIIEAQNKIVQDVVSLNEKLEREKKRTERCLTDLQMCDDSMGNADKVLEYFINFILNRDDPKNLMEMPENIKHSIGEDQFYTIKNKVDELIRLSQS